MSTDEESEDLRAIIFGLRDDNAELVQENTRLRRELRDTRFLLLRESPKVAEDIPPSVWRTLLSVVHPDRHPEMLHDTTTEATAWLLAHRPRSSVKN